MNKKKNTTAFNIRDIPDTVRDNYKAWCAARNVSMKDIAIALFEELTTANYTITIDRDDNNHTTLSRPIRNNAISRVNE